MGRIVVRSTTARFYCNNIGFLQYSGRVIAMSEPIGFVSYANGAILAELLGRDEWRVTVNGVDNPVLARTFAARFADHYKGPQDGYYGQLILNELAAIVGGVAVFNRTQAFDPGAVY
jgi:hypothetical protein